MRLLLDTNVLLWWFEDSARLTPPARTHLATAQTIMVSAATVWEIEIKRALGKLNPPEAVIDAVAADGFVGLDITPEDGAAAGALPRHHDDPFDRMLVAQAARRGLTLMTSDRRLTEYDVAVILLR